MRPCRDVVVVAYGRTPYCKARKGALAQLHPVDFAAQALQGVLARIPALDPAQIDDLIMGCALPFGVQGNNIARLVATRAGLPDQVCGQTVNRFCASGLQAISIGANTISCGEADVVVAGGVESMSQVPMYPTSDKELDAWLLEHRPEAYLPMGITAENVARRYHISRAEMEDYALISHQRAAQARDRGAFTGQIIPISLPDGGTADQDEGIRTPEELESMHTLKPCFLEEGVVTAATSSPMTDGAGFVVLMEASRAAALGLKPLAQYVCCAIGGVPAEIMGIGPTQAVPKVLARAGLTLDQLDCIELNEAFAAQTLACIRLLGMDPAKTNPDGGALALGHPLGATGAMLTCKLISHLTAAGGGTGMVTMCIGGGMGAAGIFTCPRN